MPRILWIAIGLLMMLVVVGTAVLLLIRSLKRSEDPPKLLFKWILTFVFAGTLLVIVRKIGFEDNSAVLIPAVCVLFGIPLGAMWAPSWGAILAKPFTAMFDGGDTPPDPTPFYSVAFSRRKQGKYEEAIKEIQQQLQRFPDDFRGQIMLAQIQAEDLNDLAGAQQIIQRICSQEGHSPGQISGALMQLADWQIRYWQDPDSARESLEEIRNRFPETEYAHVAAQRIAHLASREHLLEGQNRTSIHLTIGDEDIGLTRGGVSATADDPASKAAEYVKHLELHPLDCDVREKLALIYAEHYQRIDYAIDQLEQILQQPGVGVRHAGRVLNTMADIHIKFGRDLEAARQCLQRIIDQFPNSAPADTARQRLGTLKLELRGKQESQAVQLGTYEQDIGLKKKQL